MCTLCQTAWLTSILCLVWQVVIFFPHLVLPEGHQLIFAFAFSVDFDANNIFRAFFGGHGGGYSFDSSPGMFFFFFPVSTSSNLLKHGRISQRKVHVINYLLFSFFKRFWTWKFLFPVWLKRRSMRENAALQWTKWSWTHSHLLMLILLSVLQNLLTFLFQEVFDSCIHSQISSLHWC